MADKSKYLYDEVPANEQETDEVVIPNGETWEIQHFFRFCK